MTNTTNTVDIFKISPESRADFYKTVLQQEHDKDTPFIALEIEFMKQWSAKRVGVSSYEFSNRDLWVEFRLRWA